MPAVKFDYSEKNESIDVGKTKPQDLPLFSQRIEFHLARKPLSSSPNIGDFNLVTLNPTASSLSNGNTVSTSSNKPVVSEFVETPLDPELAYHVPFRRIGAGLENLGNTCYLNSVLQCLTYTEPLVAYLQNGKHQDNNCHTAGFCALCAMHNHISRALQSTGKIFAPKHIVSNLRCISRNFRNARQEDAHEYMLQLLESMHKCCIPSGVPSESPGAYEKSLVYKIFGGSLRSQVKCLQCSYCSNKFDLFLDLSLEISKADSLHKALAHFTAAEQLDGGEREYKCERCKQKVRAVKQLTVYKPPYILGIHLKRFRSLVAEKKIDKKVHFDTTLDLKPFVSGAYEGDFKYKLYGVLVHAGWSTRSGHYYCFVCTPSGMWYSLDDQRVSQVNERTVLEQKAYMLFYARDRVSIPPKKALDAVQKENLMSIFQTSSSSCSVGSAKALKNDCADKNPTRMMPSGIIMKDTESSKVSEVPDQQKTSQSTIYPLSRNGNGATNGAVCERMNTTLEKAADEQKENLKTASQIAPHVKVCQNDCADKNSIKMMSPGFIVKDSENCKAPELPVQQNILDSAIKPTSDSGILKDGVPEPVTDNIHPRKSKLKLSNYKGSISLRLPRRSLHRKLMKTILKSRAVGMHLSTQMLFGASLSLRMRRKFKRMKQKKKDAMQEQLLCKDVSSMNVDPSTSDRISKSIVSAISSHKNGLKSCLGEGEKVPAEKCLVSCSNSSIMNPPKELEDRLTKRKSALLAGKLTEGGASCSLEADRVCLGDSSFVKQWNSQQLNGEEVAVARGCEEIGVGHWEGIESPQKLESDGHASFSMGYVLDTWDEEYDRGKRKKLRVKRNDFGGPNPFQEISAKKAKLKARNATNQPSRIR